MNYTINKFFEKIECGEIINFCIDNGQTFNYDPKEIWDCRRIYDLKFKEKIYKKLIKKLNLPPNIDYNNVNISLTRYYENRFLDLHLDKTSSLTTVIVLSEDFENGKFILSESSITINKNNKMNLLDLKIGEGISFDGSKIYHGVMPVNVGVRCALNIWINNENHKFVPLKKEKTLL